MLEKGTRILISELKRLVHLEGGHDTGTSPIVIGYILRLVEHVVL